VDITPTDVVTIANKTVRKNVEDIVYYSPDRDAVAGIEAAAREGSRDKYLELGVSVRIPP
jgi:hypothetical protein